MATPHTNHENASDTPYIKQEPEDNPPFIKQEYDSTSSFISGPGPDGDYPNPYIKQEPEDNPPFIKQEYDPTSSFIPGPGPDGDYPNPYIPASPDTKANVVAASANPRYKVIAALDSLIEDLGVVETDTSILTHCPTLRSKSAFAALEQLVMRINEKFEAVTKMNAAEMKKNGGMHAKGGAENNAMRMILVGRLQTLAVRVKRVKKKMKPLMRAWKASNEGRKRKRELME